MLKAKVGNSTEIDDGRRDCIVKINGVDTIIFTQEGMENIGISYEQGKALVMKLAQDLASAINGATP